MKKKVEKFYGKTVNYAFKAINPIKKIIIKTPCIVHKFINEKAIQILYKENKLKEWKFFNEHLEDLNEGVVWADQDFKSINHFFHYEKEKGLYGFSNAYKLCEEYYKRAKQNAVLGDMRVAVFYLGAACHLLQDSNVPQHVHNRLLKQHRSFENWIKFQLVEGNCYNALGTCTRFATLGDYIRSNAQNAYDIYYKCSNIEELSEKYKIISNSIILKAESTTAGLLMDFYEECNLDNNLYKLN